jgi:cytochrome d ubiquinol oxidase subunit II
VQRRAYDIAFWAAPATLLLIGVVSLWTPFLGPIYAERWFAWPQILLVVPVPLAVLGMGFVLLKGLTARRERSPFFAALGLFVLCFIGLGISFFPYMVPHSVTIRDAAAPDNSLAFLLVGAAVLVPMILAYTAYAYWVFRGKVNASGGYH